ncbi:TPA: phage tail family protein [Listeria monocytogenes]|uniref:Phage tail family protein n=1 Tax=Listeria monocytogenes TaxID=1639 RepID=A0A473M179_LISMN|nr:phage tail family protein [Listeria monocytogenes]EAG6290525.1 phage tail family protein [Listeria monocytogenes CFSAN003825]EAG6317779.1 phage tail family protein [Listeria monocytogenes CFSAN003824]EAG6341807.1 phage tail family protein [Listeria monocytogenes CFSAN003811]MDA43324.1 phage tail family protein [Listeria monocytogenes serotype 1/2a]AVS30192.1 phage tail family protein [Listeria monocytogenes]
MSDLFLELNGKVHSLSETFPGLSVQEVSRQSPQLSMETAEIAGTDGVIPGMTQFKPFIFSAKCNLQAHDIPDYHLAVREIYEFLFQRDSYYIWSDQMPGIRYEVHPKPVDFSRESDRVGLLTIEFDVFKGYAESRGTSLDPMTFEVDLWQMGMNLSNRDDLFYIFKENTFRVYNAGSDRVNPLMRHELDIAMTANGTPTIHNLTTGESFEYQKELRKTDVLLLNNIYPLVNNRRVGKDTNHGIITLEKGWNDFEIKGVTDVTIAFNFPFIYR